MHEGFNLCSISGDVPTVFARNVIWKWYRNDIANMILTKNGRRSKKSLKEHVPKRRNKALKSNNPFLIKKVYSSDT